MARPIQQYASWQLCKFDESAKRPLTGTVPKVTFTRYNDASGACVWCDVTGYIWDTEADDYSVLRKAYTTWISLSSAQAIIDELLTHRDDKGVIEVSIIYQVITVY